MARVALCQDVMVEYMGFMAMSAVLKSAGHEVEVFFDDQRDPERFVKQLQAYGPDVAGFSLLSPSVPWALGLAPRIKARAGAVTVFGNVHVMMSPEIVEEPGVDMVCLGEGEAVLLALCDALDRGADYSGIAGTWVKTAEGVRKNPMATALVDMDAQPYIDRNLYDKYFFFRHSPYLRVMTGRGCPFRCSFCSNPVMTDHYGGGKKYFRKRSPESAVAEIEHLIARHPRRVKHIFFIDEVFWIQNEWLRRFLALYKERIRLPFSANFRFGPIAEDDIRLLAEAGASGMALAVESGSEAQRKGLMNKPVSNAHIEQVAGWMHKYGIRFGCTSFFGLPGDTAADHVERLAFYRKVNPSYLWTTFFQPYPGLALTQHPEIRKYLPEDKPFEATLHHDMYLELPDRQRLVNLKKVYFYMMRFPWTERPLLWLTQFRIPLLFDLLFMLHFTYYVFLAEKISVMQWLVHLRVFALNPVLRKKQPLQGSGRPFVPRIGRARGAAGARTP